MESGEFMSHSGETPGAEDHQRLFQLFEEASRIDSEQLPAWIRQQQLSSHMEVQLASMLAADHQFTDADAEDDVPRPDRSAPHTSGLNQFPEIPNYRIEKVLDRGGAGIVYQAVQLSPRRPVAIKMLRMGLFSSDSSRQRFLNEASAASGIDHPAIVPVYETGAIRGEPFISMKLIDGTTLERMLRESQIERNEAVAALLQVCRGIAVAHARGIIHRDLKPSNILIAHQTRTAWVTDFGLARNLGGSDGLTATGDTLGTPGYMAPEQLSGATESITAATDVYGLGATLYRILTDVAPIAVADDNPAGFIDFLRQHEVAAPREKNSGIPAALNDICMRAVETNPADRYASAAELADDLQRYLDGEPVQARPLNRLRRAHRWARHRPGLAVTICMVAAFLTFHSTVTLSGLQIHDPIFNFIAVVSCLLAIVNAAFWQHSLRQPGAADFKLCCWSLGEVLLLSLLIAAGEGLESRLIPAWAVLIALSGLRRRPFLVVLVTTAALANYGGLWLFHTAFGGPVANTLQIASNMLSFALVGLIQFAVIRQSIVSVEMESRQTRHSTLA